MLGVFVGLFIVGLLLVPGWEKLLLLGYGLFVLTATVAVSVWETLL